jgi:hypothetical protein
MKKISIFQILLAITVIISIAIIVVFKFSILESVLLFFAVPTVLQIIISLFGSNLNNIQQAYNRKVNKDFILNQAAIKNAKRDRKREFTFGEKGKHIVWASSKHIADRLYDDRMLALIKNNPDKAYYYINPKRNNLNGK